FALRQRFGLPDLVDDLAELIEWLGLERPAVMGVSFGGMIALELAARHPSRLRRLVVQGVGSRFEQSLLQQLAGVVPSALPRSCVVKLEGCGHLAFATQPERIADEVNCFLQDC